MSAVLVSGDGDFSYAVQAVKDMGKHVEVAAFPSNLSSDLVSVSDDRVFFTPEYFDDLWSRRRFYHNERGASERGASPGRDTYRGASGGPRAGGYRDREYDSATPSGAAVRRALTHATHSPSGAGAGPPSKLGLH